MAIERSEDKLGGAPHISGHRIAVHHIVREFRDRDRDITAIAEEVYPHLSEDEVREAIVWALDNDEEFSGYEDQRRERLREIEAQAASPPEELDA